MKSNKDFKIDEVVNYAFNFYNQNGRGLNAQDACIAQIMQMTGLDYATSIDIQTPVLDALMYIEMRDISNQITSQLHNTVSDIIGQRLHSINIGNIQSKISSQPVSLDTSPLQNITENEVIFRNTPNAVNKLVKYTIQQNGLGKGADAIKNVQNFNLSYDLIKDNDAATLNNGLWGYTIKTQTFNLGNNIIGATGLDHLVKGSIGIDYLQKGGKDINLIMQGMFTLPTTSIVNLNLCNNNIGDVGSEILCHALVNAKLPATKSIDVSGNNITEKGEAELSSALTSTPNESLSITIEKHSNASGVWNFLKKGFKYYTEALAVKTKGNGETAVAIYGQDDWAYCKKIMVDFQREVSVGFIKHTNDVLVKQLMQKAPDKVKKATVGAVFVVASVDAALGVDVENLAYCIAAINKKAGSMLDSLTGTHNDTYFSPELIGSNGETEDF